MSRFVVFFLLFYVAAADINLHNPRGGNNRFDEDGRERRNSKRLFDSQNNNRGGHNVGGLYYYTGSHLKIQWAHQHSCNDRNNHCELVLQYMCGDLVRDGTTTNTIPEHNRNCLNNNCSRDLRYGMHEDSEYYWNCKNRERNKGLFTSDRNLQRRETARFTRQNENGNRYGYECPEEKDYYPYWHPTPWKDIAVFTNNASRCEMYRRESENVKNRSSCVVSDGIKRTQQNFRIPNNKKDCEALRYIDPCSSNLTSGHWVQNPHHGLPPPECLQSIWSRDNHQGNTVGGQFMSYDWVVPDIPHERCVFRIRYNITAGEYDGWHPSLNSNMNNGRIVYDEKYSMPLAKAKERGYVYTNDPDVTIFKNVAGFKLKIQINTNQDARTFQDRSHTFAIRRRPASLGQKRIHNVNVRGKRGNIVQVFPSTEYDFVPNTLTLAQGEYVHLQWTGSNSNPRNNAGEGQLGSDRHNVLPLADKVYSEHVSHANTYGHWGRNYPKYLRNARFLGLSREDLISLAILNPQNFRGDLQQLDDASPYYDLGPRPVKGKGTYYYMSTRNNNFSNRSQKAKIVVI